MNQYTAWTNGVKVTLFPLIESLDEMNCITVRIYMVSGKQFEKEMKKNLVCFSIVPSRPSYENIK